MLRKAVVYHLIPFLIAICGTHLAVNHNFNDQIEKNIISGSQKLTRGKYSNLTGAETSQLDYVASISNPNQVTIFGSSELTSEPFNSPQFLPDSFGIPTLAIGHAYHQDLAILGELLLAKKHISNSKICIILSLGWFEHTGTNTSAFVEFFPKNVIRKILHDKTIDSKYIEHIGEYINRNEHDIAGLSTEMKIIQNIYLEQHGNWAQKFLADITLKASSNYTKKTVQYKPTHIQITSKEWLQNESTFADSLNEVFLSKIKNNLFVNNQYFNKYIVQKDGSVKTGNTNSLDLKTNRELKDFRLVVDFLKENNANCSFIIQPLNPHYFKKVSRLDLLHDTLLNIIERNDIPVLDLYSSDTKSYVPGTLKDVMHLGAYGWMQINYFLRDLYGEQN